MRGHNRAWAEGLSSSLQLAPISEPGQRLTLTGVVRHWDSKLPASNVVIYAHQTNAEGLYANGSNESEWSRRDGRLRGWVKTGPDGVYTIKTIKPAPYPNRKFPAHIHLYIKEPDWPPYYIDDVVFAGEFGVTSEYRAAQELRGGGGIIMLQRLPDGGLLAKREIILERHN